jgi:xanthine dehydrogenase accessory factor
MGLDLGAQSPEEIALSIVSEIKTVFSNRSGLPLKNRESPIYDRI